LKFVNLAVEFLEILFQSGDLKPQSQL